MRLANSILQQETLGAGLAVPLRQDSATGDFEAASDADNIRNCIFNIITTRVGERVMNEDFGTEIPRLLFENAEGLADVLPLEVVAAVRRWEPRVSQVRATGRVIRNNGSAVIEVDLRWTVRSTGQEDNLVYPYYAEPPAGGVEGG